jgi:hypothetical protein
MADFAKWATACESAFTQRGSFSAAYDRNRTAAIESLLEDDLLAEAILRKLEIPWEGGATELLDELNSITGYAHVQAKDWPKDAKSLSGRLHRLSPLLREKGINSEKLPRTSTKRGWRLASIVAADLSSLPSSPSTTSKESNIQCDVIRPVGADHVAIDRSDDRDVNDDKSAGFSDRQRATPVLSDIEAAYEELRNRGDTAGPPTC